MCETSLYQLFLQTVGIVAIALLIAGIVAVLAGFEFDLVYDSKKGGKK